ncbi:PREDICTED: protein BASIC PENTACYSTEINE7 [Camelina sativa]|uniref:GAGA-binding transcriptional activator n=1 Tax=Camelina sativa TaxID=90675 RepID=A0ABM0ZJR9_CAMSA|nr:PREDICTED: protein BASIC PENTACYSTEINE7 [Camelina sativa]
MNPFPSQNLMLSATNANKDAALLISNAHWFHSHIAVPKTTGIDLSQVSQANPAEGVMVPQSRSFHPPTTIDYRNGVETVEQKSTNQSPPKALKPKTPRKKRSASNKSKKTLSIPETKREKKNLDINIDISSFDTSGVPPPVCSCTGVSRVCYKWGMGGWQSSCCTISISTYPLPMSTTRPGARLAGRKMSNGAYVKLLARLAGEGYSLSHPVDLKNHWARHGTNKFVTFK